MKVLIVEDETSAYENLKDILLQLDPNIDIMDNTESVIGTVQWLRSHPSPDLIFMDIHLSDASAFSIFEAMEVEIPIIFTTAYDQYAIDAFKVNSVDYLLKPIKTSDVARALEKFRKLSQIDLTQYLDRITQMAAPKKHKDTILITYRDKLLPISLSDVFFFYTSEKNTMVYLNNETSYPYPKTLEQIMSSLDPSIFFRANKQYIISRESIRELTVWFDSRLLLTLKVSVPERIYISKNKASEFKNWMVNEG